VKKRLTFLLPLFVLLAFLVACAAPTAAPAPTAVPAAQGAAPAAACADANRVPISWSTIAGFYTDAMTTLVKNFEAKNCVKVTVVNIDNSQLYDKQIIEAAAKTGAYDVYTIETAEKAGFAENGYIVPLDDYIKANADAVQYNDVAPILADITTQYKGHIWGLPYYTYTQGQFYRKDLWDDPTEQAAFKAKYGYDLVPPTTWDQLSDMAQFFTRKAGEKLKGQVLTKDFYGIGLMAGRFQEIQDEMAGMLMYKKVDWIHDDGTPGVKDDGVKWAIDFYVHKLLPYAPAAALTVTYDGVMNQFIDGQIAQTSNFFLDQYPNAVKVEDSVPGAKLGVKEGIEKRAYVGAFLLGVASASKHQKEAMDFVAYIGGPEAQKIFASMGGTTTRISVLQDPQFNSPDSYKFTGHFKTLLQVFASMTNAPEAKSNLYYSPYGAKIYNSLGPAYHRIAAGEVSIDQGSQDLYDEIVQICNGKCPIYKTAQ
jgi:multiple sugar transport system substrate-binding protein